jgi:hypothetical protein
MDTGDTSLIINDFAIVHVVATSSTEVAEALEIEVI